MMVNPNFTPVHSFLGGLMMAAGVTSMAGILGQVLGISGFFHQTVQVTLRLVGVRNGITLSSSPKASKVRSSSAKEQSETQSQSIAILFTSGLVLGGMLLARYQQPLETALGTQLFELTIPATQTVHWIGAVGTGLLVGAGTKWGSGCTSGHFLCGLSRLSPRSIVATATFFGVAVVTHLVRTWNSTSLVVAPHVPVRAPQWKVLAVLQFPVVLYALVPWIISTKDGRTSSTTTQSASAVQSRQILVANVAALALGAHFALGLGLTGMLRPSKVLGFLSLTPGRIRTGEWDPSLALVALGGIVPSAIAYFTWVQPRMLLSACRSFDPTPTKSDTEGQTQHQHRTTPSPVLDRACPYYRIPTSTTIDQRLVGGAAVFGLGWGLSGACPGPVIVNLAGAMVGGNMPTSWSSGLVFTLAMAVGGQLAATLV